MLDKLTLQQTRESGPSVGNRTESNGLSIKHNRNQKCLFFVPLPEFSLASVVLVHIIIAKIKAFFTVSTNSVNGRGQGL